ncbi:MAG: hypothetical protein D3909_06715, partial [Candidatus Electrothrix sp. ATG1]|nr:hypothetical protein [Candidatus Electrothrix sp. ATG1]
YLEEAISCLQEIRYPLFAIPGNHDYWSRISFTALEACCKKTGGAWLMDQEVLSPDGKVAIFGSANQKIHPLQSLKKGAVKRILLHHYPASVDNIEQNFDLILSGHSHGGQIRLPFYGALTVPYGVGKYDKGLFQTKAGPLFVSVGTGYWALPVRVLCRPEIALIEM